MQLRCKHWYYLSTLRVSGQAKITFGENEVSFSDRCAEAGRPYCWTVRSEIIWYDFPKRSAYNATASRNRQKNYNLISLDGQYGENLICLLGLKKFMLPFHAGVFPGKKPRLVLTYFFFSTYPRMYWIIRDSQNWVTAEVFIHYISMASLSVYAPQCEYQSWNFRQQHEWPVVFKSRCSFNWKIRYIRFSSHVNQKLECLWMLDGHFSLPQQNCKCKMNNSCFIYFAWRIVKRFNNLEQRTVWEHYHASFW